MSIGPWITYGRNSQLTFPGFTYFSISVAAPSSSKALQCGQESEPISINFTVAFGLPIIAPADVALTTSAHVPPGGGAAWVIVTVSLAAVPWVWVLVLLHPASARAAMAQIRNVRTFIGSNAPVDHGYFCLGFLGKQRRAAGSRNLRGKRLQTGAKFGIGDLAQTFAELLGHRARLRPLRPG